MVCRASRRSSHRGNTHYLTRHRPHQACRCSEIGPDDGTLWVFVTTRPRITPRILHDPRIWMFVRRSPELFRWDAVLRDGPTTLCRRERTNDVNDPARPDDLPRTALDETGARRRAHRSQGTRRLSELLDPKLRSQPDRPMDVMGGPPMRLILSRKGFDSSAKFGGGPSPILPDGRLVSFPIPAPSNKTYAEGVLSRPHAAAISRPGSRVRSRHRALPRGRRLAGRTLR